MGAAKKMLLIGSLVRSIYGQYLFRRLLSGVMAIAGLIVVTSVLLGAMLIGGFYFAYLGLLHFGWELQTAFALMGGMFMLMTTVCVAAIVICLRRLGGVPFGKIPAMARAGVVVDAFLEGFTKSGESSNV